MSNSFFLYIYIYIYVCVCVCVCVREHTPILELSQAYSYILDWWDLFLIWCIIGDLNKLTSMWERRYRSILLGVNDTDDPRDDLIPCVWVD